MVPSSAVTSVPLLLLLIAACNVVCENDDNGIEPENYPPHVRLTKDLLDPTRYERRVRPVMDFSVPTKVYLSMSLYQLVEVNEPSQHIALNVWVIQRWEDEFLGWDPLEYDMINVTILLPYEEIWLPDTILFNSVVMSQDATERYIKAVVNSTHWQGRYGAHVTFMYPAIYRMTCRLDVRYFPYDQQNCTLLLGSWTSNLEMIDYYPAFEDVNMNQYIASSEWEVISFKIFRHEKKYECCKEPWALLHASLVIRRKPLYWTINMVIPTAIITIVAVVGFFTPSSTSGERREKMNLGIDTMLAMLIMMLMVTDQMPTSSEFLPLIGWFFLTIICVISMGTFLTALVLLVQRQGVYFVPVPYRIRVLFFRRVANVLGVEAPGQLLILWKETGTSFQRKKNLSKNSNSVKIEDRISIHDIEERDESDFSESLQSPIDSYRNATIGPKEEMSMTRARKFASFRSLKSKWSVRKHQRDRSPSLEAVRRPRSGADTLRTSVLLASGMSVTEMKLRRLYALEWAFLATLLDRIFLTFFGSVVIIVTLGMIIVGHLAMYNYDT
uniref:Uncharacterized protein n=1 Tax=Plectus sambesii TaxID=2011161 RepID=A0A914UWR5_9BILA